MSEDLFTAYERLETCRRVEVTVENLHVLAQHFGGTAIYAVEEGAAHWQLSKPRIVIPRAGGSEGTVEVGAWVDDRGNRWNPEPLTQGWNPEGTYKIEVDR
jgi:hypothetical protein